MTLTVLLPIALVLAVAISSRTGLSRALAERPAAVTAAGLVVGALYRWLALPDAGADAICEAARLGLGLLAFLCAQQCRPSRIAEASPAATRLVLIALPLTALATAGTVFALMPGLGLWSALLVGLLVTMGVGTLEEGRALTAPIPAEVKRTVRMDAAFCVVAAVPAGLLIAAAGVAPSAGETFVQGGLFAAFAGAAIGGAIGLLSGRLVPLGRQAPLLVPVASWATAYLFCRLLGYDAVMASVACGLLYAQEAGLAGVARSHLFSAGIRWCAPPAFFALGATFGPVLLQSGPLLWLAALVPVLAIRPITRSSVLGGTTLGPADRSFLTWFGGAPGAAAALFILSLLGSTSLAAQNEALSVGALAVFVGVAVTRATSDALVTRLIRASARSKKRRYGAA